MELRDLEYFAVIGEHGHLGRAAEALRLSQPALSKSLRRLERVLEVKLVNRTPKGIELTAEGTALLGRVAELRVSLQSVAREISELGRGHLGLLKIGAGPATAERFLPSVTAAILREAPQLKIKVTVSDNDVMLPAARAGELDLVVNYVPQAQWEGLTQEHLYDDEFVVCAAANHPLATGQGLAFAQLAGQRWALSEPSLYSQKWLHRKFEDLRLPVPLVALEARSAALRLQIVASSDLLDFTSRSVIHKAGARLPLAELPVEGLPWRRPIGLIYRRDAYLTPSARRFSAILWDSVRSKAAEAA